MAYTEEQLSKYPEYLRRQFNGNLRPSVSIPFVAFEK